MRSQRWRGITAGMVLFAAACGCGGDGGGEGGGAASGENASGDGGGAATRLAAPPGEPPAGAARVSFPAADGVKLDGWLAGEGRDAVVLVHMGNPENDQSDWFGLASRLAGEGLAVLTFDRRGVCPGGVGGCSRGSADYASSWKDVVGAVRFVERRGARRVVVVGASIGAMSSLYAVASGRVRVAGLVEIAGINDASGYSFDRADLESVSCPKVFVSAKHDPYGGADAARQWFRWARPPKRLVIVPSYQHGTDMLRPGEPTAGGLERLIVEFAERAESG